MVATKFDHGKYKVDWQRAKNRHHNAAGLCCICDDPLVPGKAYCQKHLDAARNREAAKRRAAGKAEKYQNKIPGKRRCNKCGHIKPLEEFSKEKQSPEGRRYVCKTCNSPRVQNRRDIRAYGLTTEEIETWSKCVGDVCEICGQPETMMLFGKVKRLTVDHDHATNKLRGRLCHSCNVMLGCVNDDITQLENAIAYLRKHGK